MKTFNLEMRKQRHGLYHQVLQDWQTSSEGPPRASGDEETKTSEAKTKLPREGLLRPGLTCPRSRGEEIREKRVKSKTRPGKRQSVYFPTPEHPGTGEQYFGSRKLKTDANKTNSKGEETHTINRPKKWHDSEPTL